MAAGQARLDKLGVDREIRPMHQDANRLSYDQIGANGLVINLSCHNIKGSDWFDRIPNGTQVVLQTRNNDPAAVNQFETFEQFDQAYRLSQTQYQGTLTLQDPDGLCISSYFSKGRMEVLEYHCHRPRDILGIDFLPYIYLPSTCS